MSIESRIYAIYDVKSGMYGPAMTFANDGTALRSFQEMLTSGDKNSLLCLYPADYVLFCLGLYDQQTGKIESCPAPMNIISGAEAFTRACVEANARRKRAKQLSGEEPDFTIPPGLEKNADLASGITSESLDCARAVSSTVIGTDDASEE